jgi:hypothetical protein
MESSRVVGLTVATTVFPEIFVAMATSFPMQLVNLMPQQSVRVACSKAIRQVVGKWETQVQLCGTVPIY